MKVTNPEVFYVAESKDVTVSITFLHDGSDRLALLNAAEALKFYYDNGGDWKSWAKRIEVKR